jgi:hypothetical protein
MMLKSALVLTCIAGLATAANAQNHPVAGAIGPYVAPPMTDAESLWDQSAFDANLVAVIDTEFPDFASYSTYMVDDFGTDGATWNVESVSAYFTQGFGVWDPAQLLTGKLQVYPKAGSLPNDANDIAPEYDVAIRITDGGGYWIVSAETSEIAELQGINGEYWIGLTPIVTFGTFGQEFHLQLASFHGDQAACRNPGQIFGFGPNWFPVSNFGFGSSEMGFKLEGTIAGGGCYADCTGEGELDFFDFLCFQNAFAALEDYAECTGEGDFDFFDFLCFQNAFAEGC